MVPGVGEPVRDNGSPSTLELLVATLDSSDLAFKLVSDSNTSALRSDAVIDPTSDPIATGLPITRSSGMRNLGTVPVVM